tara:strand:- start:209 stop:781 length:573 start_codon:yes stop_codon:yes gene_type:complete
MFAFKKNYFLIIENTKDIDLSNIKKHNKFLVIYRNLGKREEIFKLIRFRKKCRLKQIKFFVANNYHLASLLNSDGIYLSAHNKSLKALNFKRLNYSIIGSAHNFNEIFLKKKQGCDYILLSRLFFVSYKKELNYLNLTKYNKYSTVFKNLLPLGGINILNLNKMKSINCEAFAIYSEIKKKPAKIFSRLF